MNFTATREETALIASIVSRAEKIAQERGTTISRIDAMMDIEAAHCNGCPLDLGALLSSQESDFVHDFAGINRHLNRKTGELKNCFLPRCALPETQRA